MKKLFLVFLVFLSISNGIVFSQSLNQVQSQTINQVQRWIKIGISLREAKQYSKSEEYLLKGLSGAKSLKNQYWEAVAYEYLGLLNMNYEDTIKATSYFSQSINLYKALKMQLSVKVVNELMIQYQIAPEAENPYYGGIEIGSKGVKFTITQVKKSNEIRFINVKNGSKNVSVIELTDNALNATSTAVKEFMDTLLLNKDYNIKPSKIFIVVSSGVKQEMVKAKFPSDSLIKRVKTAIPNYSGIIHILDVEDEVHLGMTGCIPGKYLYSSSFVDIGSGNSKGGYKIEGKEGASSFNIPYGTSTLSNKFKNTSEGFNDRIMAMEKFVKDTLYSQIGSEMNVAPGISNKKLCFVIGGAVWAMCNYLYPEKVLEDYQSFLEADIDTFIYNAKYNYEKLINPDLSYIKDPKVLEKAQKEIQSSTGAFKQEQMIAGALILKQIVHQLNNTGSIKKRFVFSRYSGSTGWISGYIGQEVRKSFEIDSE